MFLRKVESMFSPKLYNNDFDIVSEIRDSSADKISDNKILSSNVIDMRNGQTIIDKQNKRKVVKIDGYLYKETVDADNNVILTKID